jgi:3-deoxy-D-arabino-heptulosonate 7-phosphate (DAHP) synthase class II
MVRLNVSIQETHEKICSSFSDRNKLEFNDGRLCLTNRMGAKIFSVKVPQIITFSFS